MWQVVGHEWAIELLERSLAAERVAHAYLLVGPPQIGKRTLALNFAQALNCVGEEPPCGQCPACQRIAHGNHPDVRFIEAAGTAIKIEQIREMQREVALSPHSGRWKVFIIREMERATAEAANCLLKTLEEPPSQVVVVLTAGEVERLLPTIVSRCQVLALRPLSLQMTQRALEERWGVEAGRAELLARLSGGRLGWAVVASQGPAVLERRAQRLEELHTLMGQGRVERLEYARKLSQDAKETRRVLELWLSWWRDLLLMASGCPQQITNVDYRAMLEGQVRGRALHHFRDAVEAIQSAIRNLESNVNPRLTLEVLMLHLSSS